MSKRFLIELYFDVEDETITEAEVTAAFEAQLAKIKKAPGMKLSLETVAIGNVWNVTA